MSAMPEIEYRSTKSLEFKPPTDESAEAATELLGYASTYDQPYEVEGMIETISRGAFDKTLSGKPDVFALISHDPSRVVARTSNGTLQLVADEKGLRTIIKPINTQDGRDLVTLVETGTLDAMSFGFVVKDDKIEMRDGRIHRAIVEVELHEVSVVAFPANANAKISVRCKEQMTQLLAKEIKLENKVVRRFLVNPLAPFLRTK